jgi:signal transduction histidine kinase
MFLAAPACTILVEVMSKILPRAAGIDHEAGAIANHASLGSELVQASLLVALYVGLEWLSFLHEHAGLPVTPWNPGLGLMFAMIILKGRHYGVVFFIGVVASELLVLRTSLPWFILLTVGIIVAAAYTAAAEAARRTRVMDSLQNLTRDILVIVGTGLAGATFSAIALYALLLSISQFDMSDIASTAAPLVLGDLIGIAVVTPIVIRVHFHHQRLLSVPPRAVLELIALSLAIVLVLAAITLPIGRLGHSLFYLLFLPVVFATVRHGFDGACIALSFTQLALVGSLHLQGFDLSRFTEYQLLMLVLTLTALTVGALVSERQLADDAARRSVLQLQEMQAVATRAARLNLISGMAAAIAHEVNQPLTAARALARSVQQLILNRDPDQARVNRNIGSMIEQIDHAAAVVRRMREFLRRGEPHVSTLDIEQVLADASALVRPVTSGRRIRLDVKVADGLPPVFADRVQIQQVIMNLVMNSVESIADDGDVEGVVSIAARLSGARDEVEISVVDNGAGIAADRIDRIFEPLSTTRPEGIGLGLSICQTIVQSHGGRIWLSSTGAGHTEFIFTLPAGGKREGARHLDGQAHDLRR